MTDTEQPVEAAEAHEVAETSAGARQSLFCFPLPRLLDLFLVEKGCVGLFDRCCAHAAEAPAEQPAAAEHETKENEQPAAEPAAEKEEAKVEEKSEEKPMEKSPERVKERERSRERSRYGCAATAVAASTA
jgi:hypothetical protein